MARERERSVTAPLRLDAGALTAFFAACPVVLEAIGADQVRATTRLCEERGAVQSRPHSQVSPECLRLALLPEGGAAAESRHDEGEPLVNPMTLAQALAGAGWARGSSSSGGKAAAPFVRLSVRNADGTWPCGLRALPTNVGPPPHGPASWADGIRAGSVVDALDAGGVWRAALVTAITYADAPSSSSTPAPAPSPRDLIRLHVLGCSSSLDSRVGRAEAAATLAPLHTHSAPWQHGVRAGDRIEVSCCGREGAPQLPTTPPPPSHQQVRVPVLRRPGSGAFEHQWFLGWVLRVDAASAPPAADVLWPEAALQAAYAPPPPQSSQGGPSTSASPSAAASSASAVRTVSLLGDDVARIGTWVRAGAGGSLARLQQLAPRPADAGLVPPPAPCLPYTEAGNEAFLALLRRDGERPPTRRFC